MPGGCYAFGNSVFFVIAIVYIFMGLVLHVVNPFMTGGKKAADLFKNVNLLLPLGIKGLKTKRNWYIISLY